MANRDGVCWERVRRAVTVTVAFAHLLSACVGGVESLPENDLEERLQKTMSTIVVNEANRSAAEDILGSPIVESEFWRFSLHRVSEKDTAWGLFGGVPVRSTGRANGYVLLTYDAQGRVVAMDARSTYGETGVSFGGGGSVESSVSLRAGPLAVHVSSEGGEIWIGADASQRDEYLKAPAPEDCCRLLVGCSQDWCGSRVSIDGTEPVSFPYDLTWYPSAGPVFPAVGALTRVQPGAHRMAIGPPDGLNDVYAAEVAFACVAGESLFALVELRGTDAPATGFFKPRRPLSATITVIRDMPDAFRNQYLLIYSGHQWVVHDR